MRMIGASVKRVEDPRILTGRGRYVDDIKLPGMLHAAYLRSPYAHARIKRMDVSKALALPGVVAVFTGEDMKKLLAVPMLIQFPDPAFKTAPFYPLATEKVRFVGDPVALVIAESRYLAEDGRDAIEVEYEPLPTIVDLAQAMDPERPPIFEEIGTNVTYTSSAEYGDVASAFARADRIIKETFRQHRHAPVPMETLGSIAHYDPVTEEFTVYASTQTVHMLRFFLSVLLNHPINKVRVLMNDVGGAFGQKAAVNREHVGVWVASKQLGRPVKWIEDRSENLQAGGQAREESLELEIAVKKDGTILGLKARMRMDVGAYPILPFPMPMFGALVKVMLPSAYRIQNYKFDLIEFATNKGTYVAYRGPWAIETFARERLLDVVARELGLDPAEIRRKNLITRAEQPTKMCTGATLNQVMALETLNAALEGIGYSAFREEQRQARARGRLLGIGMATYIEGAPGPADLPAAFGNGYPSPSEKAVVRVEPDGRVTVITSQIPHGQGHETTLAQVTADELGVPFEHVRVVYGDTQLQPFHLIGTGGSRAATMASGSLLYAARQVREKILKIGSALLEASPEDLTLENGSVAVKGAPQRQIPLAQVAMTAYLAPGALPPGTDTNLSAEHQFNGPQGVEGGWSVATHVCTVEVSPETGQVQILRYRVVEDCGTIINPAIVDGQVRGGVAQGIGAVLYERSLYDENAQYLAGTFMDYLLPTSMEIPPVEIEHMESPALSPVHFRGVGEGGMIAAPACLCNAIADALAPLGVRITEQHLPPARILELMGIIR